MILEKERFTKGSARSCHTAHDCASKTHYKRITLQLAILASDCCLLLPSVTVACYFGLGLLPATAVCHCGLLLWSVAAYCRGGYHFGLVIWAAYADYHWSVIVA